MGWKKKLAAWGKTLKRGLRRAFQKRSPRKRRSQKRLSGRDAREWQLEASSSVLSPEIEREAVENPSPRALEAIAEFSGVQLSAHTQRAYKKDLEDFFAYLRQQNIWKDWAHRVTPILVAQYRMYLVQQRKLARGSVTRKLAVLKSFYRWAHARGWVADNPAELVKSFPQTQESKTGYLNDGEIRRLLGGARATLETSLSRHLHQVVVETLLMLALRRSEAAALRVGDLEYLDGRWNILIHGKGDRERRLPLPPRLVKVWSFWLQRICEDAPADSLSVSPAKWMTWIKAQQTQPILISSRARNKETPLSTSEIAHIVRKMARRVGVVQRVSPHMLRATAITHALDHGASHRGIQQMAGWTSPLMITRYDKRRKDPQFSAVWNLAYAQSDEFPAHAEGDTRSQEPQGVLH